MTTVEGYVSQAALTVLWAIGNDDRRGAPRFIESGFIRVPITWRRWTSLEDGLIWFRLGQVRKFIWVCIYLSVCMQIRSCLEPWGLSPGVLVERGMFCVFVLVWSHQHLWLGSSPCTTVTFGAISAGTAFRFRQAIQLDDRFQPWKEGHHCTPCGEHLLGWTRCTESTSVVFLPSARTRSQPLEPRQSRRDHTEVENCFFSRTHGFCLDFLDCFSRLRPNFSTAELWH